MMQWLKEWWGRLFSAGFHGKLGMRGELSIRVIRKNPSFVQRVSDFMRGLT